MKKIGVITFHRSHNYGAVLQSYALRKYIENSGTSVELVDYWPDYRKGTYDIFSFKERSKVRNVKNLIKTILFFKKVYKRYYRFNSFILNELGIDVNCIPKNTGEQIDDNYKFLFFGSDQIWRYNEFDTFKGLDEVYWGSYPRNSKVKKIAYAASMGKLTPELLDKQQISGFLNNFNSIAVREQQLLDYIQPLTDKEINHVLDPVFLLSKAEWIDLVKNKKNDNSLAKKYLLLYNLNYSIEANEIAEKIAKEKNLEIYKLSADAKSFNIDNRTKDTYGPLEFLNIFLNAEYIVATSFHGVAFSVLLNKNFYSLGLKKNADRVKSLLSSLGIENRYVENGETVIIDDVDYEIVNQKLEKFISFSKNYIKKNIQIE